MLIRTISAFVLVPLLLGLTYLGGKYTALLVGFLTLMALWEFMRIGEKMGIPAWYKTNLAVAVLWLAVIFSGGEEWMLASLVAWILIALGRLSLGYPKIQVTEVSYNFTGLVYTVVLLSHLYLLRQLPGGAAWAFLSFFLVWATDTGAYLIGRAFGKHPLSPRVSPNKTVEGSLGGLLTAVLVAVLYWNYIGGASLAYFLGLALVAGVAAQLGDLFESALKRSAGVKDSGKLIPGHGGVLDRFDSFVFAIPVVYYSLMIVVVR